jgi:hypothetical protein
MEKRTIKKVEGAFVEAFSNDVDRITIIRGKAKDIKIILKLLFENK